MKATILVVSLLLSSAFAGLTIKEFEKEFHQVFSDSKAEAKAKAQLEKTEESIEENNERYEKGESTFVEQVNELSDLTSEELESEKLGYIEGPQEAEHALGYIEASDEEREAIFAENEPYLREIYARASRWGTPSEYDARKENLITPARHQKTCGSCAAFAATAVHETCYRKQGVPMNNLDLSEEQLMSCGYGSDGLGGCDGAYTPNYLIFFQQKMGGVGAHEKDYPYRGIKNSYNCDKNKKWNAGAKVTQAITDTWCSESKLQSLVHQYGAVATGIKVYKDFYSYKSGIYTPQPNQKEEGGHAITVVGYFVDESQCYFWGWFCYGNDYWIIKNSWGPNWGENGFFKMRKGYGDLAIAGTCSVAECSKAGSIRRSESISSPKEMPKSSPSCDLSEKYAEFFPMNGDWKVGKDVGNSTEEVEIKCVDSVCTPMADGVEDACEFICGSSSC